jgi:2,4-diketo-3-deoxy-L-fuconate hydrolase
VRLVTYKAGGRRGVGVRSGDAILDAGYGDMLDLINDGAEGLERAAAAAEAGSPVEDARLLAPLRPGKILCSGINYASHREENPEAKMPEEPFFFAKLPSALSGPGEPIVIPAPDSNVDWEVEFAFVIGTRAKHVTAADAMSYVFGYTLLHDVSARDIQFKDMQITLGKNPDGFSPIGPELVTADEIPDPGNLRVASYVNGEQMQSASTAEWLFPIPALIEHLTRIITLEPGDLVSTGTPAGVGCFRDPPIYLKPGDEVSIEAEGVGRLTNPVVAGW